jgi:quercetin dioxygenase-like cupin family protein
MRRLLPVLALVVVMLGTAVLPGRSPVRAQEATPAADEAGMEGLSFTLVGVAPGVALPGTVDLSVARAGFAPGAGFPFDASDPEGALVIMESGELTIRVEEQSWHISRGAALEQAMTDDPMNPDLSGVLEEVAMGTEATLQAGDVAHIPGNLTGEVRNTSDAPASALLVLIDPSMMDGQATPTS